MNKYWILIVGLTTGWAALFCAGAPGDKPIARINGEAIAYSELVEKLAGNLGSSESDLQGRRNLLEQVILHKLFVQRARELGYAETLGGSIEKRRADLCRTALFKYAEKLTPTAMEISRESSLMVNGVRLRIMEVATYDTAMVVDALIKQGVPFESLVVRFNRATFGPPDGDLGYSMIAQLPREVIPVLQNLKVGQASGLVMRGVNYDFIQLLDRKLSPFADSAAQKRDKIVAGARWRKAQDWLQEIKSRVEYDEEALDLLARKLDTIPPAETLRVVARRSDGYKVRINGLIPIVKRYASIYPALRRKALKEDIENDLLEREAIKLRLDQTPDFKRQFQQAVETGLYQYFYDRQVNSAARVEDAEALAFFQEHPERFAGRKPEEALPDVKDMLGADRRQKAFEGLVKELRDKARVTVDSALLAQPVPKQLIPKSK